MTKKAPSRIIDVSTSGKGVLLMATIDYKTKKAGELREKAKQILSGLPAYCQTYYDGIAGKAGGTIYSYMRCLDVFFQYLISVNPELSKKGQKNITLEDLALLTRSDIYDFINSRYIYNAENLDIPQENSTKRIYLSALSSFFSFWEDEDVFEKNVVKKVDRSQYSDRRRHRVIRLDDEEEQGMIDAILYGKGLTEKQQIACEKTRSRDYAICLTLLRTGIRVSELVGLDIGDINFKKKCFSVARKKSTKKDDIVFFDDDVDEALQEYLGEMATPFSTPPETPVFRVSQGKYKGNRLTVRSVESIVAKYSKAGAGKQVYPHKLRASYATNMIAATGNIELVKEQLGHMNIQTTTLYIDDAVLEKEKARNLLKEKHDHHKKKEGI